MMFLNKNQGRLSYQFWIPSSAPDTWYCLITILTWENNSYGNPPFYSGKCVCAPNEDSDQHAHPNLIIIIIIIIIIISAILHSSNLFYGRPETVPYFVPSESSDGQHQPTPNQNDAVFQLE